MVANSRQITAAGTVVPSDDLVLIDGDIGEASTARRLIEGAEQRFGRVAPKPFLKSLHPIPRLATVQEIVEPALFLVRASFFRGEVLYVDGGAHAGKW